MHEAWASNLQIADLPQSDDEKLPEIRPEIWARWSAEQKAEHKANGEEMHDRNHAALPSRRKWLKRFVTAEAVQDEPTIWLPHFACFRGRLYSMVTALNPQGDDASAA